MEGYVKCYIQSVGTEPVRRAPIASCTIRILAEAQILIRFNMIYHKSQGLSDVLNRVSGITWSKQRARGLWYQYRLQMWSWDCPGLFARGCL